MNQASSESRRLDRERWRLLLRLERWLETPMLVLGFVWLVLLVVELVRGLSPPLLTLTTAIWIVFIVDFALRFTLAPRRLRYLRRNWLTAISLALPALRVLRIVRVVRVFRIARSARGLRLVKMIGSMNRGMRALGKSMGRRGFAYALVLTILVILVGAAGMYAFESDLPGGDGLDDYWSALWWTAMLMTSFGSEYWPRTVEGRMLAFLLALYAIAVFGYVTAALASFFVGRDAASAAAEVAGEKSIERLRAEVAALRAEVHALAERGGAGGRGPGMQP